MALREAHDEAQRTRVYESMRRFGSSAVSFLALESQMRTWFDAPPPDGTGACVAFFDTGSAWVAAGDPLAPAGERARAARRFVDAARAQKRRACFFASEALEDDALDRVLLGEQPIYRVSAWKHALRERRRLREQLRRARAKGVVVRRVDARELSPDAPLRAEVQRLVGAWLASRRMAPMQFLVALEPFHAPDDHRYYVAERAGRAVEFLSAVPIPARGGWLVEDLLRAPDAPNGTTESLLHALMLDTREEDFVTLGLAPLTGPVPGWMRAVGAVARPLYSFAGLRAFKERLHPASWQPVWLVVPRGASEVVHVVESLRAFAGGSLVRFAARSLAHASRRALAALALAPRPAAALPSPAAERDR